MAAGGVHQVGGCQPGVVDEPAVGDEHGVEPAERSKAEPGVVRSAGWVVAAGVQRRELAAELALVEDLVRHADRGKQDRGVGPGETRGFQEQHWTPDELGQRA